MTKGIYECMWDWENVACSKNCFKCSVKEERRHTSTNPFTICEVCLKKQKKTKVREFRATRWQLLRWTGDGYLTTGRYDQTGARSKIATEEDESASSLYQVSCCYNSVAAHWSKGNERQNAKLSASKHRSINQTMTTVLYSVHDWSGVHVIPN